MSLCKGEYFEICLFLGLGDLKYQFSEYNLQEKKVISLEKKRLETVCLTASVGVYMRFSQLHELSWSELIDA